MTRREMLDRLEELRPMEEEYYRLAEQIHAENLLLYGTDEGFFEVHEADGEYYLLPVN